MRQVFIVLIGFMFIGCATKHYGRQINLTNYEKEKLECKDIKLELEKASGLINYVRKESSTIDGKEILAFLGDFGVGNLIESESAQESAMIRIDELRELQVQKGCK